MTATTPAKTLDLDAAPHIRPLFRRLLGAVETHTNLREVSEFPAFSRTKRIVICADGTWNTPTQDGDERATGTNVWMMYQLVSDVDSAGVAQLKYYHAGVGSAGDWLTRRLDA